MNAALRRPAVLGAVVAFGLTFAAPAALRAAGPASGNWQAELKSQLKTEQRCELAYLTRIELRTIAEREVLNVRLHCADSRIFDARRDQATGPFEIQACDAPGC